MEIGRNLSKKIETLAKNFEVYLLKQNIIQLQNPMTINEKKDAFFSLKTNRSPVHDGVSFNVIRNCFGSLSTPLLSILNSSLQGRIGYWFIKPVTKTTLETTDQFLFCLVSQKTSKELCIKDYIISCQKIRFYI